MADASPGVDQSKPSIARVYDYLLGGKDNYEADRVVGDKFRNDLPGSVAIAHANRQNLIRAVREIALAGIDQFVDLGSGLPTADNVHQIAQRHIPAARVAYVDNDPIVLAHGRALLADNPYTRVIRADVREPRSIRRHPDVGGLIDFERPVGVIHSAVLHHLNDDEQPAGIVRYWREQVPLGSYFFISHFRSGDNAETREAEAVLQTTFGRGRWRSDEEIRALFEGLELVEPGIVPCSLWRPDTGPDTRSGTGPGTGPGADGTPSTRFASAAQELTVWERLIVGGLARKP